MSISLIQYLIGLLPSKFTDTSVIPESMNDDNREEPSQWVQCFPLLCIFFCFSYSSLAECDFLVDSSTESREYMPRDILLNLNSASLQQPSYLTNNTIVMDSDDKQIQKRIDVVQCRPLLDAQRSRFPYRSYFFGSAFGSRGTVYTNFCLWRLSVIP